MTGLTHTGFFLSLDGPDGGGKTTQTARWSIGCVKRNRAKSSPAVIREGLRRRPPSFHSPQPRRDPTLSAFGNVALHGESSATCRRDDRTGVARGSS